MRPPWPRAHDTVLSDIASSWSVPPLVGVDSTCRIRKTLVAFHPSVVGAVPIACSCLRVDEAQVRILQECLGESQRERCFECLRSGSRIPELVELESPERES